MSSKRDFAGALLGDALLPFIRRPVEDVIYQTIDDRQIPNRSDFKELRDLANGLRGQLTGATSGVRRLAQQLEALEVRIEQLEASTQAAAPAATPDLEALIEGVMARLKQQGWTPPRPAPTSCKVPECEEKSRARGFCGRHYQQWRRGRLPGFPVSD
jgi:hypothetical protein